MRRGTWFPLLIIIPLPFVITMTILLPVDHYLFPLVYVNIVWVVSVLISQQVYHKRMWHKCKHCGHNRYMHDPNELVEFPSLIKIVCKTFERSHVPVKTNYYDLDWRDDK